METWRGSKLYVSKSGRADKRKGDTYRDFVEVVLMNI